MGIYYKENKELKKQLQKAQEENKELQKSIELLTLSKNYNEQQIEELKKQIAINTNTMPDETIQQLEYVEKALNKKTKIDINFIKSTISILLKAMKYSKQQGGAKQCI